jgi:outer membrane lipoprotein-sorting protein
MNDEDFDRLLATSVGVSDSDVDVFDLRGLDADLREEIMSNNPQPIQSSRFALRIHAKPMIAAAVLVVVSISAVTFTMTNHAGSNAPSPSNMALQPSPTVGNAPTPSNDEQIQATLTAAQSAITSAKGIIVHGTQVSSSPQRKGAQKSEFWYDTDSEYNWRTDQLNADGSLYNRTVSSDDNGKTLFQDVNPIDKIDSTTTKPHGNPMVGFDNLLKSYGARVIGTETIDGVQTTHIQVCLSDSIDDHGKQGPPNCNSSTQSHFWIATDSNLPVRSEFTSPVLKVVEIYNWETKDSSSQALFSMPIPQGYTVKPYEEFDQAQTAPSE